MINEKLKGKDYFEQDKPTIEQICRRDHYEYVRNQRTYCSNKSDEICLYRADEPDTIGYRCMNISNKDLWLYEQKYKKD